MDQLHVPLHLRRLLHLYKPGVIDDILAGIVWEFNIKTFATVALTSVAIPILMVMLSMTLPARANRTIVLRGGIAVRPLLDVQPGGRVLDVLHRSRRRARSDRARRHPALRLDLALHVLTVDARARRTTPTAARMGR